MTDLLALVAQLAAILRPDRRILPAPVSDFGPAQRAWMTAQRRDARIGRRGRGPCGTGMGTR